MLTLPLGLLQLFSNVNLGNFASCVALTCDLTPDQTRAGTVAQNSTKDVFRSSQVLFHLSEEKIAEIAAETFPKRQLTSQKLGLLKKSVNLALFYFYAPVDNVRVEIGSSGNDLVRTLTAVDNKLALAANRWLLAAAGRKYASTLKLKDNRAFDGLVLACGYSDYADFVEATISEFRLSLHQILKWTNDRKYLEQVLTDLSPLLKNRSILIHSFLPSIFEEVFEQKCGIGTTGPCTRFIVGVLRASRLHKGNTRAIQAAVVKSLQRRKAAEKAAKA